METLAAIQTPEHLKPVKEVIASFLLGLKNLGLYAEDHDICRKCLQKAFDRLEAFLDRLFGARKEMAYHDNGKTDSAARLNA